MRPARQLARRRSPRRGPPPPQAARRQRRVLPAARPASWSAVRPGSECLRAWCSPLRAAAHSEQHALVVGVDLVGLAWAGQGRQHAAARPRGAAPDLADRRCGSPSAGRTCPTAGSTASATCPRTRRARPRCRRGAADHNDIQENTICIGVFSDDLTGRIHSGRHQGRRSSLVISFSAEGTEARAREHGGG